MHGHGVPGFRLQEAARIWEQPVVVISQPGMIVLVEGIYEEDGSNNANLGSAGGVGGQIKGRFNVSSLGGPPTERRDVTLGIAQSTSSDHVQTSVGAGYGWIDFLGVGSQKAIGRLEQCRQLRKYPKVVYLGSCACDSTIRHRLSAGRSFDKCNLGVNKRHVSPIYGACKSLSWT